MTVELVSPIWLWLLAALPAWWLWLRPRGDVGFLIAYADDEQGPTERRRRLRTTE